jgi:hypothetical protein
MGLIMLKEIETSLLLGKLGSSNRIKRKHTPLFDQAN